MYVQMSSPLIVGTFRLRFPVYWTVLTPAVCSCVGLEHLGLCLYSSILLVFLIGFTFLFRKRLSTRLGGFGPTTRSDPVFFLFGALSVNSGCQRGSLSV